MTTLPLTEASMQDTVMDAFRQFGWLAVHFRPAQTKHGWRTPLQGDKGFPDVLAVRGTELLAAELKGPGGKCSPEQEAWLAAFRAAGVETWLVTPASYDTFLARIVEPAW